jgi:hydroxymethylpyrimidine pyrophosphatase-like HAD family hydrolase
MWYFPPGAFDLDDALAEDDHSAEAAITAIKAGREELRMILATGRILGHLAAAFPGPQR